MAMKRWETLGRTFAADFFKVGDGANFGSAVEFYDELFFKVGARGSWVAAPAEDRARTDQKEIDGPESFRKSLQAVALSAPDQTAVALWRRVKSDRSAKKYFTTEQAEQAETVRLYLKSFYNKVSQALETRERKAAEAAAADAKQALRKQLSDESLSDEERAAAKAKLDAMFSAEATARWERARESVAAVWKSIASADGSADDDALVVEHSAVMQPCFVALFKAAGWKLPDDMKV